MVSAADETPEPGSVEWEKKVRRSHNWGTAGVVLTGLSVPMIVGGANTVSDNFAGASGGILLIAGGIEFGLFGTAFTMTSSRKNAERLSQVNPDHSTVGRTVALSSLGGTVVWALATAEVAEDMPALSITGYSVLGAGFVGGAVTQYALNRSEARRQGIPLQRPAVIDEARAVPTPSGFALVGRF